MNAQLTKKAMFDISSIERNFLQLKFDFYAAIRWEFVDYYGLFGVYWNSSFCWIQSIDLSKQSYNSTQIKIKRRQISIQSHEIMNGFLGNLSQGFDKHVNYSKFGHLLSWICTNNLTANGVQLTLCIELNCLLLLKVGN